MSDPNKDVGAVFDAFAEDYDAVHRKNLGVLGKNIDTFARYKVQMTAELLSSSPGTILEFGCGTGRNLSFLRQQFPDATLYCSDISDASLQKAKDSVPGLACFNSSSPDTLIPFIASFDLVFLSCVLHHIPVHERQGWINALATTVKPGGHLIIFEHNPWNPATRYLVSTCPFDEGVVLVYPGACARMLQQSGLQTDYIRYALLFPWRKNVLVTIEKFFDRIPLGGQYCLFAEKSVHG